MAAAKIYTCSQTMLEHMLESSFIHSKPRISVTTICHQVRCMRLGHLSLFHTATYFLYWNKKDLCETCIIQTRIDEIDKKALYACAIWYTQAFSLKNNGGFTTKSYCSHVCAYDRSPQTLSEIGRDMQQYDHAVFWSRRLENI